MYKEKYLSHRLLGYDEYESSINALKKIMNKKIKYIEIDTRVSKNGVIYINHNPTIKKNKKEII